MSEVGHDDEGEGSFPKVHSLPSLKFEGADTCSLSHLLCPSWQPSDDRYSAASNQVFVSESKTTDAEC